MGTNDGVGSWAEIGAFVLGFIGMLVGAALKFAGMERTIDQKTHAVRLEMRERTVEDAKAFGDTGAALRQKITEVEIWSRDTFVRRDEFKTSLEQVNRNIDALRASSESANKSLDDKLDRLDMKLDAKLEKLLSRP